LTEKALKTFRENVCKFIKMTALFTLEEKIASFPIMPILLSENRSQIDLDSFSKNGILLFITAKVVIYTTVGAGKPAPGNNGESSLARRI